MNLKTANAPICLKKLAANYRLISKISQKKRDMEKDLLRSDSNGVSTKAKESLHLILKIYFLGETDSYEY